MENEDEEKIAEAGFTPLGAVEDLNADQILDDQIFQQLCSMKNLASRERLYAKLQKRVKELKIPIRTFNNIYKQHKENYIKGLKSENSNVTNFSECKYRWTDKDGNEVNYLNCGNWIADDMGIYKIEYNSAMQPIKIKASPIPIIPIERIINIDTQTEKIKLGFFKDGKWNEIIVEKNTIASKSKIIQLANRGLEVTDENAKNLINYLTEILELNIFKPKYGITHLGWVNEEFVPYTDNYIFDGSFNFKNIFECVSCNGNPEEWKNYVKDLRKNKTVRFMIDSSFASPLVKIYKINSFIVHLWGRTEGGKTVSQMIAASVWGHPAKGKLLTSLNATSVAAERMQNFFRNLPFIPDELQTIKKIYKNDFESMIYDFTQGKGKDRGTIDGGLQDSTEWDNITIMSGEEPITNNSNKEGAKNRVIEIEENNRIIEKEGSEIVAFIFENHGFAGKEFIKIIQDMDKEELYELRKKYVDELNEVIDYKKQINAISVILVADYIVSRYIFNEKPLTVEDVKGYFRNDTDEADRIIDIIIDIANANINNFYSYSVGKEPVKPNGQVWGKLEKTHDGEGNIIYYDFIPQRLYEILGNNNVNWNGVKNKLANKGYVIKNKTNGKYQLVQRIGGTPQNIIRIKNIYYNKNEDEGEDAKN